MKLFWRIAEACAQTRKRKKQIKTYGFPRFFVGRVFFAKDVAVEVNSTKKTTLGGQFEGQNGVEVALGGQFGRQNGVQVALGGEFEGQVEPKRRSSAAWRRQVALGVRLGGVKSRLEGGLEASSCAWRAAWQSFPSLCPWRSECPGRFIV